MCFLKKGKENLASPIDWETISNMPQYSYNKNEIVLINICVNVPFLKKMQIRKGRKKGGGNKYTVMWTM